MDFGDDEAVFIVIGSTGGYAVEQQHHTAVCVPVSGNNLEGLLNLARLPEDSRYHCRPIQCQPSHEFINTGTNQMFNSVVRAPLACSASI